MLATAVAMNLEGAKSEMVDEVVTNPAVAARMGALEPRHFLSAGLAARTMHQQHWLAVLEAFFDHLAGRSVDESARWTSGPSMDGTTGAEATASDGVSASAAARFTRGLGNVVDKVTPGGD